MRQKNDEKHLMFGAPNLSQSKKFTQPLVVMVETLETLLLNDAIRFCKKNLFSYKFFEVMTQAKVFFFYKILLIKKKFLTC